MAGSKFMPRAHFLPSEDPYQFLPFRFMRWSPEEVLLVNEVGEHLFLQRNEFYRFVDRRLGPSDPVYVDLKSKNFLASAGGMSIPIELLATKYRTKKSFLDGFTKLHMFVVTLRCDHSCHY